MKNLLVAIIVSLSFSIQAQSTLDGLWDTGEANTKIDVSEKNSLWSGVVKASDIKDDIGELILKDLKKFISKLCEVLRVIRRIGKLIYFPH